MGNTEKSDTCIEDCSIAAITLQYTAESLDLSSCWCQIRLRSHSEDQSAEAYVREKLDIPGHFLVECIIGIGYPGERKSPHSSESLDWDKIRKDRW
jgi:nitroreductase